MTKERSTGELDDVDAWNSEDELDLQLPSSLQKYAIVVASRD
jgi:hypothetical protein